MFDTASVVVYSNYECVGNLIENLVQTIIQITKNNTTVIRSDKLYSGWRITDCTCTCTCKYKQSHIL